MKTLVIYDSIFGNTQEIAKAIAEELNTGSDCDLFHQKDIAAHLLKNYDLIIIGSPTRGFKATADMNAFLKSIPDHSLDGISMTSFDTRILLSTIKSKALRWMVNTGGYAAKPISRLLQKKGGTLITQPLGFYVSDEEGPLVDQELDRAKDWAIDILSTLKNQAIQ